MGDNSVINFTCHDQGTIIQNFDALLLDFRNNGLIGIENMLIKFNGVSLVAGNESA